MLTREGCAQRLLRARRLMEEKGWDALLLVDPKNIYSLEGVLVPHDAPAILWVEPVERPLLVMGSEQPAAQAEVLLYPSYSPRNVLGPPWPEALAVLAPKLKSREARRIAVEMEAVNGLILATLRECFASAEIVDGSATLADLRRSRQVDEVQLLRRVSRIADAAYERARSVVRPGVSELEVYAEMCAAMVKEAGGPVQVDGDFSTGPRSLRQGGAPTGRVLEAGDLCVYDLFPTCWGYQIDLCRTICVGPPSAEQQRGWELVCRALRLAEEQLLPGRLGRDIYSAVKALFEQDELSRGTFWHHLGHGIGMGGHEAPRLVPESNHVLWLGDVISIEPGIYNARLQGGLRLENAYWLTENGPVQLNSHPLAL